MDSLVELFPDGDFRFHLTLRRGEPRDFFKKQSENQRLLDERRMLIVGSVDRYTRLLPEGKALLNEFESLCAEWNVISSDQPQLRTAPAEQADSALRKLRELGGALEPDFLLLSADDEGQFRLRGGALCFPTGWALEEKLGHTLDFIHGIVPGLNSALGSPINQFLAKLKPGVAFLRHNWGIAASDDLNQHPARGLPPPTLPVELDRLWLRVEHQALVALPESGGVVFGIRIANHRLDELRSNRDVVLRLNHALSSMPQPLADYKRIGTIRSGLMKALGL
jgi:hypothetical protein